MLGLTVDERAWAAPAKLERLQLPLAGPGAGPLQRSSKVSATLSLNSIWHRPARDVCYPHPQAFRPRAGVQPARARRSGWQSQQAAHGQPSRARRQQPVPARGPSTAPDVSLALVVAVSVGPGQ